jgi:hypothetical protein
MAAIVEKQVRFRVVGYPEPVMRQVGSAVLRENLLRWNAGTLVSGGASPALKQGRKMRWSIKQKRMVEYGAVDSYYAQRKVSAGKRPLRDLSFTGHLRAAMQVLASKKNEAQIGPVSGYHASHKWRRESGKRATTYAGVLAINNWRARMWGVGEREKAVVVKTLGEHRPIKAEQK